MTLLFRRFSGQDARCQKFLFFTAFDQDKTFLQNIHTLVSSIFLAYELTYSRRGIFVAFSRSNIMMLVHLHIYQVFDREASTHVPSQKKEKPDESFKFVLS
jgi:hypothetical protein